MAAAKDHDPTARRDAEREVATLTDAITAATDGWGYFPVIGPQVARSWTG